MLKSWSIQNFKPIVDSGELELAPITILTGFNNSGKSSLLQSILMVAQTLGNRLVDQALLPNDRFVQLGTFENILSEYTDSRILQLAFELTWSAEDRRDAREESDLLPLEADKLSQKVQLTVSFRATNEKGNTLSTADSAQIRVEKACIKAKSSSEARVSSSEEPHLGTGQLEFAFVSSDEDKWEYRPRTNSYRLHDPFVYAGTFTNDDGQITGASFLRLTHFLPTSFMPEVHSADFSLRRDQLEKLINDAIVQITTFFSTQIRYLGSLRAGPDRAPRSFAPTSEFDNVGNKGEYDAKVYHTNKNTLIDWYNPYTHQIEKAALQRALNLWAQYLKIAEQITTEDAGLLGVTWQIVMKKGQKARLLPEVGAAVSQILPLLIMGLLSPTNGLLIIEQPELYLHPFAMARLGDFFLGLAKCKKQCLIEMHSENLVSQMRLHIVQAGGLEKSNCLIYFVGQDEKGAAQFTKIKISPRGNILNWPEGFFDETLLQQDRITEESLKQQAKSSNT